jgi:dipeptidyl aminopeptidase/acylaminoacyl peptidase
MKLGAIAAILGWSTLLAGSPSMAKEPLEGAWVGHWIRDGSSLEVTMHFAKSERGYEGSFDSDALRVTGIPIQDITSNPPDASWRVVGDATTSVFTGRVQGDVLEGRFKEGEASGSFSFSRAADALLSVRREEITFASGDVTLAGTIFTPAGNGPHPGIVFLHGSGAEGRWASNYLAEKFSRRGFAALTFDKRGVGKSSGNWQEAGFEDLAADADAAVSALSARPYVARGRVGIHGHSQGGTISPMAAVRIGNPAFVIGSAAAGLSMRETEIFSVENSLGVRAMSPPEATAAREFVGAIVAVAYDGKPRERLNEVWQKVRKKTWAFEPPPATDPYWAFARKTAGYDPLSHWRQVSAPVLLVYGELDERVQARASAARIAEAYLGGKGTSFKAAFFASADHTFRLPARRAAAFAWPKTAPGYPEVLIDWALQAVAPIVGSGDSIGR